MVKRKKKCNNMAGQGLVLAGGALKLAGQGNNFKKLSKDEQIRVVASILKILDKAKNQKGKGFNPNLLPNLGLLPDLMYEIKKHIEPKTKLGRKIRNAILKMFLPQFYGRGKKKGDGGTKLGSLKNKWVTYVKLVQRQEGCTYGEALKIAKKTYKK